MADRCSRYRVARMSIFPPQSDGGQARYALIVNTIRNGVPHGSILLDGVLPNAASHPTTEQLLELFDSALRQNRLV